MLLSTVYHLENNYGISVEIIGKYEGQVLLPIKKFNKKRYFIK